MKKPIILTIAAALAVSACAKNPDAIAPATMYGAYDNMPCQRAWQMLQQERATLASLESRQRTAVAQDAVTVWFTLVPTSSLTGTNVEGRLAQSKGKVQALEARVSQC